ncbi:hypothetical protein Poly51_24100 [Rubripirellula tenax]|uniref:Uncharacterized protein n=1 Tax=Rubripirellula tenax TaxID=2528015 RepID=A0A5C6FA88_9BACT|nr:hypothetical protein [Rubripirellula tenax]TWU56499.1 hypothetical protein Poly51_24100 [Rubripirellula tenax]
MTDEETPAGARGIDLESGMLARVRQWTDVFPWVRLSRCLRIAGAPSMLFVTAIAMAIHAIGLRLLTGSSPPSWRWSDAGPAMVREPLEKIASLVIAAEPTSIFWWPEHGGVTTALTTIVWSMLVWIPVALMLARQGGLLAAGRPMAPLSVVFRYAVARTAPAWIVAMVPLLCVAAIGLIMVVVGVGARSIAVNQAIEVAFGFLVAVIAIPAGLLAFGSIVAIPIGWAALANEGDADPLDSLSRGYEYFYRRPVHCLGYGVIAAALIAVAATIASGVAWSARSIVLSMMGLVSAPISTSDAAQLLCGQLPIIISVTLFWGLGGGVYLLLRAAAGGQEVEDLWIPPTAPTQSMPSLRSHSST